MIPIICDGNSMIGAGHFYRCLSILKDLENDSREVVLFIPEEELLELANDYKINYRIISGLYEKKDALYELMSELEAHDCRVILIDTHRANEEMLAALHEKYKVVFIDDLFAFPYPVDVIVNGHIDVGSEQYQRLYENSDIPFPELLVGAKYFATHIKKNENRKSKRNLSVGFFAGGSDPDHVTIRMLEYIRDNDVNPDFHLIVVVGNMNKDYEKIRCLAEDMLFAELVYSEKDLSRVYQRIDIAISAAGLTLYELVCSEISTIAYSMVDNQIHTATSFERLGLSINIGDSRYDPIFERMFSTCHTMIADGEHLPIDGSKNRIDLDGKGAERIAKVLEKYEEKLEINL